MIKRGLALIVAVFAMVQLAGGTLPAEAEEPAAMYETVTRADGGACGDGRTAHDDGAYTGRK